MFRRKPVPRHKMDVDHQLILEFCDLLGVGWSTDKTGRVRLATGNPSKGSVLYLLRDLEGRVAEVEAENAEGRRDD